MGGVPCAKVIVDNREGMTAERARIFGALDRALGCMENSIILNIDAKQPTYEMQHRFEDATADLIDAIREKAEVLAAVASEIDTYVQVLTVEEESGGGGGGSYGRKES